MQNGLKDWVTSIISLTIVGFAGVFIWTLYHDLSLAQQSYDRAHQLLQAVLGLAGTVTGYYLGRVPAENQANAARQEAKKSNEEAAQSKVDAARAQDAKAQVVNQVKDLRAQLAPAGGAAAPNVAQKLDDILRLNP